MATKSTVGGGNSRYTYETNDGHRSYTSENGRLVDVTDHHKDGSNTSHEISRGTFGSVIGPAKKDD